ncbi:hypothetical protein [Avrilella dinanensis]|uniref:Uncharacterized protein n=1 Tax=Avrilella dinanensis TaxID=2008672 RepID=A0A2M9R4G5_9FLAO|nr:hypothetical protein [Avrilella dinanensis]PJR03635.1 hypothetical protein CDL10_03200 [Avrilella dinanensis]
MAKVRHLKRDINFVIGDLIDAVYFWEIANGGKPTPESDAIIDDAINQFDTLISRVNQKDVDDKKSHYKQINKDLEATANSLVDRINGLS